MTTQDALAWAEASENQRWALAKNTDNEQNYLWETVYQQMHADALAALARAVREGEQRWETLKAKFGTSDGGRFYWEGHAETALTEMRALEAQPKTEAKDA